MKTDTLSGIAAEIDKSIANMGLKNYHCENLELLWTGEMETDFEGKPLENPPVILEWDGTHDGHRGFLKIAKSLNVPLIYTKVHRFTWKKELFEFLESVDLPADEEEEVKKISGKYSDYEGYVSYILLVFNINGAWHTYQEMAPWYRQYLDEMEGNPESGKGS
jgi:hypothetical protein